MQMIRCAAILFDMDGVLVDSRPVVARVWRRWADAKGLDGEAILKAAQGRRTVDTLRSLASNLDVASELRWLDEAELNDGDGIVEIPGASELVASLPDGRWAVVTSAGRELAQRRLDWAGLPSPDCLITADEVSKGKPFPDGYLQACQDLGVVPADSLVIEDSPAGIEAARSARMRVVGLSTTHRSSELPPTEAVLPDLRAISAEMCDGEVVLRFNA
jgi:sugar-phosphatase